MLVWITLKFTKLPTSKHSMLGHHRPASETSITHCVLVELLINYNKSCLHSATVTNWKVKFKETSYNESQYTTTINFKKNKRSFAIVKASNIQQLQKGNQFWQYESLYTNVFVTFSQFLHKVVLQIYRSYTNTKKYQNESMYVRDMSIKHNLLSVDFTYLST